MVSGSGAGDIEELAFGVVNFLQVRVVSNGFDPLLKRDHLVVAGHDHHGAEFEALRQVHGADGDLPTDRFDMLIENLEGEPRLLYCCAGSGELSLRPNEDSELVGEQAHIGSPR